MRSVVLALLVLAAASGAAAQGAFQPVTLTGDFDADGKPDKVELKLAANGVKQVMAHLAAQPDTPQRIVESAEPGANFAIELRKAGSYPVLYQGKTGDRAFAGDVFLVEPGLYGRRLVFWEDGFFRSAWLQE